MVSRVEKIKVLIAAVLILLNFGSTAWGQGKKLASLAELAAYAGADREQLLLTGAKGEGKVVWYTSLAGSSYKELAKAFEARYPGIKVEAYRGTSRDLMTKIMAEAQAKRYLVDVVESTLPLLRAVREDRMLAPYTSPYLGKYPADAKEKGDRGLFFWVIDRESYIGVGHNTNIIPSTAVPKSYADFLKPGLKGKMGFVTSDTGVRTTATILRFKGEEFIKKLKAQDISLHTISGRAMVDLVISGEVPVSPTIFREHALEAKGKGAPIDWVPMEIVPTNAGGVSLVSQAAHPHAAVLMADFLLSPQGQKVLEDLEFGSASKDVGFKRWYPETELTTAQYEKESARWEKLLREIGRK